MATVLEFTSPSEEFPLGSVFETLPDARVELERLIPHHSLIIPYFWVRGADATDVEAAFDPHAGVTGIRLIDSVEDEHLMRAEWDRDYVGVLNALAETHLVLLSGLGTGDGWHFEVRGETHADISHFRSYCQEHEVPIDITAVHALVPVRDEGYELTQPQREALLAAFDQGYFDSPRQTSLESIASNLGITQQSLSSRLRRGHRRLIAATLVQQED